jgi:hypothetical protein
VLFCRDVFQHRPFGEAQDRNIQHRPGEQLLQLGVLILQRPKPVGLKDLQTAILGLPFVKRRRGDRMAAAYLRRRHPCLLLLQYRDDLLIAKPAAVGFAALRVIRPSP